MAEIIAFGAGWGSSQLVLDNLKEIKAGDLEVVYINTHTDLPETETYLYEIQQALDFDVTVRDAGSLYDYCIKNKIVPSIRFRWCTDKFKIRPMKKYIDGDIPLIGLTYDEKWRARDFDIKGASKFPLINQETTRYQIEESIQANPEIPKPCKSGCFFCPFQSKEQWRLLYFNHLDLFQKALILEKNAMSRNPNMTLYSNKTYQSLQELSVEFLEQVRLSRYSPATEVVIIH
jgi:hypothetical protein